MPKLEQWTPQYAPWRHGGWYVTNVHYRNRAIGCVSRNYADKQWRIVCGDHAKTYRSRDAAARAEYALARSEAAMTTAQRAEVLSAVFKHAKARWCWDDQPFLEEAVDQRYGMHDTPADFVDALARHYDLEDPGEPGCW